MRIIRTLLLILLTLTFSQCAATSSKRSFGEVVDDAVISNRLKVKYIQDKQVKAQAINVDTWKGVVTLRGRVAHHDQRNRAIELAERQNGVREVKSYLVIGEKSTVARPNTAVEEKDILEKPSASPSTTPIEFEGEVNETELDAESTVTGN